MKKRTLFFLLLLLIVFLVLGKAASITPSSHGTQQMEEVGNWTRDGMTILEKGNSVAYLQPMTSGLTEFLQKISNPYFLSLLLILGIVGAVIEVITPGFGMGGVISIASLILFFSCNYVVGNSQWYAILIFLLGILCVGLEIVTPGLGIPGISGMFFLIAGIVMNFGNFKFALYSFAIAVVLSAGIGRYLVHAGKTSHFVEKIMLNDSFTHEKGYLSRNDPKFQIGDEGIAATDLHPTGFAVFNGERLEVSSDKEFISHGENVRIVKIDGYNIYVSRR